MSSVDLFGKEIIKNPLLRDKFIEPPFSVLDTKSKSWVRRKKQWKKIGIKSEIGRDVKLFQKFTPYKGKTDRFDSKATSIFDPALCEVLYHWFCEQGDDILDPFAGGSVRGIVANYLGYRYTGIDIRKEQIDSNREQGLDILDVNNQPNWFVGDSNKVLNDFNKEFDFIFSCPPYADLEVYSSLEGDVSNMSYQNFCIAYESIIQKSCKLLKNGKFACFVVGEIRDKKGNYRGFVSDTIKAFENSGLRYYNDIILLDQLGNAGMRAERQMKNSKKVVKIHQNVLVFRKD